MKVYLAYRNVVSINPRSFYESNNDVIGVFSTFENALKFREQDMDAITEKANENGWTLSKDGHCSIIVYANGERIQYIYGIVPMGVDDRLTNKKENNNA